MNPILYPMLAQVFLTFIVWACLLVYRVRTIIKKRVHPQVVANELKAQEIYKTGINLSDNFENLFELPVLFYVGALTIAHLGILDTTNQYLAWAFVALRAAHSLVHSTWNIIRIRFVLFLASSLCLWVLWFRIACQIYT